MDSKQENIRTQRTDRLLKIHRWRASIVVAVVTPVIIIASDNDSIWEAVPLFVGCALCAWFVHWTTNWISLGLAAIVIPVYFLAFYGFHSVWEAIIILGLWGHLVWQKCVFLWAFKRIWEDSNEDKK